MSFGTPGSPSVMTEPHVLWHVTMTLDGFIAGPNDEMDWMPSSGGMPAMGRQVIDTAGAILAGRRWHDALDRVGGVQGVYGGEWDRPLLVLTHRPADPPADPRITFVSGGIDAALDAALAAAGGRNVVVFGADLSRQALAAGRLDEIVVHIAPVLLGRGIRIQVDEYAELEPVEMGRTGPYADVRYRVVRTD